MYHSRGCGDAMRGDGLHVLLSGCCLKKDSLRKQDRALGLVRNNPFGGKPLKAWKHLLWTNQTTTDQPNNRPAAEELK
jgi:hypothetical protein